MPDTLVPSPRVQTADGLATLTASGTALANTTVETVLMNHAIGAGFWQVGTNLDLMFSGFGGLASLATAGTLTFRLRRGGVAGTILASIVITMPNSVARTSPLGWQALWRVTCRSVGSGGTVFADGWAPNEIATVIPNQMKHANQNATAVWDTTVQATIDFTAQWSVANATHSITLTQGVVMLNKA